MKKIASIFAVMALAGLTIAAACDKDKNSGTQAAAPNGSGPTREGALTGYLTDSNCGAANANAKGKGCAAHCIKNGANVQLTADERLYTRARFGIADGQICVPAKVAGT